MSLLNARPRRRRPWSWLSFGILATGLLTFPGLAEDKEPTRDRSAGEGIVAAEVELEALTFADLKGWADDDLAAAFATFSRSCARIAAGDADIRAALPPNGGLAGVCTLAADVPDDPGAIRAFFEDNFRPYFIVDEAPLLTSYYEPVLDGSLGRTDEFDQPLYRRPPALVTPKDLADGETLPEGRSAARRTAEGLMEMPDRAAITDGALSGNGLELVWLADPVDVYFVHIQGSTRIRLPDGQMIRIGYEAKNGHPYQSAGRAMLDDGILPKDAATAEDMKAWLRANPEKARGYLDLNPSYVFFRLIDGLDPDLGPVGGEGVPLTPGRSLAVDRHRYAYGLPFWIEARLPTGKDGAFEAFNRLMIAQDTGAAITGPARGDIFWGTGTDAGDIAGRVNNPGRFVVLLPK